MLSASAARAILRNVKFPEDDDPTYVLAVSGKAYRKTVLAQSGRPKRIAAALEIQRIWRGRRTRRKLFAIINDLVLRKQNKLQQSRFPHVRARYKQYTRWCTEQDLSPDIVLSFRDYCARVIQQWWRALDRSLLPKEKTKWTLQKAAVVVQRAWRRRNDMKLYRFYRDLIVFRARGEPSRLLRTINPLEAELMDKGTGVFVRFRLGGNTFPPGLYYKIFTHHNIVDMCAHSPRDYTAMVNRWRVARDANNKNPRMVGDGSKSNWYQRWENNGWRPVNIRLFEPANDAVTMETSSKPKAFNHSKLQREGDVRRKQKQRKIEWLKKMYREGSQQAKAGQKATEDTMEAQQPDALDEGSGDVEELLLWTNGLDFEEYLANWSLCGTSMCSDNMAHVPEHSEHQQL